VAAARFQSIHSEINGTCSAASFLFE